MSWRGCARGDTPEERHQRWCIRKDAADKIHQMRSNREFWRCQIFNAWNLMHESKIKNTNICMYQDHGSKIHHASYTYAYFITKVQDHRYVHYTHMHQSRGSRNIDKCIIHVCIVAMWKTTKNIFIEARIEEHRYIHHTCIYQDQASWINASCAQ